MKIIFATAVLFAVAASGAYSQACHMREIDLCMATGMFHYQSNGVPANDEKVTEWCETMKEVEECMTNYSTKCLSPLQREMMGLLSGSEDNARQLCISGSEVRARYLQHAECMAAGAESDDFKSYVKDIQVVIEKLFDVEFKERFPLVCCGMLRFNYDTYALIENKCGADAVDMIRSIKNMIFTDLPETICQRFEPESTECKNALPPRGTPPKNGENRSQIAKLMDTVFGNS